MSIVDTNGRVRLRIGAVGEGMYGVAVFDANGAVAISLAEENGGSSFLLWAGGRPRIEIAIYPNPKDDSVFVEFSPVVRVSGEDESASVDLSVDRVGDPGLTLWDKQGVARVRIDGVTTNTPRVTVCDARGTERIIMQDLVGRPCLGFADETGICDMELSRDHGVMLPERTGEQSRGDG
ncbi:MAG: hypothetical protein AB1725_08100 [Armatimonadota bacterium]